MRKHRLNSTHISRRRHSSVETQQFLPGVTQTSRERSQRVARPKWMGTHVQAVPTDQLSLCTPLCQEEKSKHNQGDILAVHGQKLQKHVPGC